MPPPRPIVEQLHDPDRVMACLAFCDGIETETIAYGPGLGEIIESYAGLDQMRARIETDLNYALRQLKDFGDVQRAIDALERIEEALKQEEA